MINKGTEKIDIRNNDIVIIDDVNSINMVSVESIVRDCTLLIDGKFPMPSNNSIVIGGKSKTISKITELIASKEIKSTFGSDTLFNNFKAKVSFWYNGMFRAVIDKMDSEQGEAIVFIRGDLSKHEAIFVRTLAKVGAKILIVSKNTKIDDNFGLKIQSIVYNTNEQLKIDAKQVNNNVSVNIKHYSSLEDIELALYEKNETVKVIVSGIGNYDETCNFYAKLYTKLNNDTDKMLYTNGFPKPSYEVTSKIQRFNSENHEYIIHTLSNFIKCNDSSINDTLKNAVHTIYSKSEYKSLNGQQLYNRVVYTVCALNEIFKKNINSIVYYGKVSKNDENVIEALLCLDKLTLLVVCSDKNVCYNSNMVDVLKLENSTEIFPIPTIDKREEAYTLAARTQNVVNNTLFDGQTLGLYKPGQFNSCDYVNFNTTFDEIELWWNKDVYLRPGFKVDGAKTTIPTYFKVIYGTHGSNEEYLKTISKYLYGKTILCRNAVDLNGLFNKGNVQIRHLTDMNGTSFNEQKPFIENHRLNMDRVRNSKNYPYRLLEYSKQQHILNKIQKLLDIQTNLSIDYKFEPVILQVGLSLDTKILNDIQWFEFYGINPNIVVTWRENDMLSPEQVILLLLLRELGFDVLLFVPTAYNIINDYIHGWYNFSTDKIGDCAFDVDTRVLSVNENIISIENNTKDTKKKGLFSNLFKKKQEGNKNGS